MLTNRVTVTGRVMPGFGWVAEQDLAAIGRYLRRIAQ